MEEAISIYRNRFEPSEYLQKPYMMVCMNVVAAESDEEAGFLATTMHQFGLNIVRRTQAPLMPPTKNMEELWSPLEKQMQLERTRISLIGSKDTVRKQLTKFQELYNVDEIMAVTYIFDTEKQKRSYEILKEIVEGK